MDGGARRLAGPSGSGTSRGVRSVMASKAPPSGQNKKQGKSLMEKRQQKRAKKDERAKRGSTT